MEVQLKNDNVQGFDTRRDAVLVSMTKSSRKGDIEKVVQQTAPVRRGTEISCDTVSAGYSAEKRTGQLFWAERHGSPVCGAEISDNNFDARNEDRSLQVSAPRNRNPRGNPKGNAQKNDQRPKTSDIVLNEPRKDSVREEIRAASFFQEKKEKGKAENPVPFQWNQKELAR